MQRHGRPEERARHLKPARLILAAALLTLLGPGIAAVLIALAGKAAGCAPGVTTCIGMAQALEQALLAAWTVILDPRFAIALVGVLAITAPFTARDRSAAFTAAILSTTLAPAAAFVLPHVAVFMSLPEHCMLNEGGSSGCPIWGQRMGLAVDAAGAAFWMIIPLSGIILAGVTIAVVIATFRHRRRT